MTKDGYSTPQGPGQTGPTGPDAEALGTVGSTGRTGSITPSQHPAFDAGPALSGRIDASTDHFKLTYFDPPSGLERHVLALFHFEWDESVIADQHPGALSQLFLTPRGTGHIRFGDRKDQVDGSPLMFSGFKTAAAFEMKGPWHAVGASLSPLGWAALTQAPANEHFDGFVCARDLLGDEIDRFADHVSAQYNGESMSGEGACRALAGWIAPRLRPVSPAHELVIEETLTWLASSLNPDIERLLPNLDYSRRQVERLVARFFGLTPAALARKMRAIRAAHLLAQDHLTDEGEAEIAAAFYDQPHMIREIRGYCGYTPTRLGGEGPPLFQTMLRMKNLDRLKQFRAIGRPN